MSEPAPEVMARFLGPENVDRAREYLEQLDPELHRSIMDFVYGEVYAGDVLDPKTRALCTVAMLAALDQQLQLGVYVRASRRQGERRSSPWPAVEDAARPGLCGWELYAQLSVDPTGLSLPILMEELF